MPLFLYCSFGVMHDGFLRVKLKDNEKRLRRFMKVSVIGDDDETSVWLSPIGWFNLGGTELTEERVVSIKVGKATKLY